jgi:hypothetical protein
LREEFRNMRITQARHERALPGRYVDLIRDGTPSARYNVVFGAGFHRDERAATRLDVYLPGDVTLTNPPTPIWGLYSP